MTDEGLVVPSEATEELDSFLKRLKKRRFGESCAEFLLASCGLITILTTAGVLYVLGSHTWAFFQEVSLIQFFGDTEWTPLFAEKHFGIWPLIMGTLMTSGIAIFVALPLGLMAAIYMSEFASAKSRRFFKPCLEILAGIPTVVYGYFALITVTPFLRSIIPGLSGFNALSAGIVMGVMIMPIISSLSEDAIYSVPQHLKEASYGLGVRKVSTILKVILPAASSGIFASIALAVSRAIGETMIVAIAAGQNPVFTLDPRVPVETMTAYIVQVSMGDTPRGTLEYETIFAVGSTLFLMTFLINGINIKLKKRFSHGK